MFVISLLGTLFFSFQVSIVWSTISNEDNEERIINIPNDTLLKEETNNTIEIAKDFLSDVEKKAPTISKANRLNISDFNFAAVGDWGCGINAKNAVANIIDKKPELVIALGDLSYRDLADCWFKIIKPIDKITKIAIGNHDVTSDILINAYMNHFNLSKQYYSFDFKNIHFVIISAEIPYQEGSEQYTFVGNDLQKTAADPNIDWIIVCYHKPAYIPASTINADPLFRKTYHPLFDKYKVDVVLQAHLHAYQRSYPLLYNNLNESNPTITTNNNSYYNDQRGEIFVTVGTGGGQVQHSAQNTPYIASQHYGLFGILNVEITNNGKTLIARFYDNMISNSSSFGNVLDEFTINKVK